ncbi:hypothetical protein [Sinomonas sp. G460-2]|uniref:hypothetical protein n=1 Tax=Sinomonas sp. G460-2 TaxID=3393464 RepID=UPI0039EFAA33
MSSLSHSSLPLEQCDETPLPEGDHPPSSAEPISQEVSTVVQRVLRAFASQVDAERIEAHREAVQREVALTIPVR